MSRFRPGWLPSVAVALLLPLLCGLGVWQLDRAEQKREVLRHQQASREAPPVLFSQLEQSADPAFRRVQLHGYFDAQHSILLDNRTRGGQAGVELLQPFYEQGSGLWLLVNRGWLAWPDRRNPPQFSTPETPLQLTAWVYVPLGAAFQLRADRPGEQWPQLLTQVDAQALWAHLGRGGWPYEVRLEPGPAAYQVEWSAVAMGPEKHLGYAVQWFAMAAALLGLFLYFGMRNARESVDVVDHPEV